MKSAILEHIRALQTELKAEADALREEGFTVSVLHGSGDDKLILIKGGEKV